MTKKRCQNLNGFQGERSFWPSIWSKSPGTWKSSLEGWLRVAAPHCEENQVMMMPYVLHLLGKISKFYQVPGERTSRYINSYTWFFGMNINTSTIYNWYIKIHIWEMWHSVTFSRYGWSVFWLEFLALGHGEKKSVGSKELQGAVYMTYRILSLALGSLFFFCVCVLCK